MPAPRTALQQRLLVLATIACAALTAFGLWWDARVGPQIDNSDTGHYIGSFATKVGVLSLVVLLGALLLALVNRPTTATWSIWLAAASLVISGLTVAGVIVWLLRHPEHAELFWRAL